MFLARSSVLKFDCCCSSARLHGPARGGFLFDCLIASSSRAWRIPPCFLRMGCRDRRLSRAQRNPDKRFGFAPVSNMAYARPIWRWASDPRRKFARFLDDREASGIRPLLPDRFSRQDKLVPKVCGMQCAGDFRRRIAEFVGQGRLEGDDGASAHVARSPSTLRSRGTVDLEEGVAGFGFLERLQNSFRLGRFAGAG